MSYDVTVHLDGGAGQEVECWWGNMTSNVSSLWTEALALPEKPWIRDGETITHADGTPAMNRGLNLLDGAPCSEAAGILADAVRRAKTWSPDKVASIDAPNGWGTGREAIEFLEEIALACARFPRGTLRVSS